MIRVLIAASSELVRAGLENFLFARDVRVVGSLAALDELAEQVQDSGADVVLIDVPAQQSENVLHSLAEADLAPDVAMVLLAQSPAPELTAEALRPSESSTARMRDRSGIRAVLPADVSQSQLVAALRAAAEGLFVVHPSDAASIFPAAASASPAPVELAESLTPREREVLQMLAAGLANKEIAARLAISEHTIKFHVTSILGKLGASSRTEAVSIGIRHGLILL